MPVLLAVLLLILVIALIIGVPLLNIWAVNTLFALSIPYTLKTWFASAVLASVFSRGVVTVSKK